MTTRRGKKTPKGAPVRVAAAAVDAGELEDEQLEQLEGDPELELDSERPAASSPPASPASPASSDLALELAQLPAETRVELAQLEARSVVYERAASALGTRVRYRSAWQSFTGWCQARGLNALPAHPDVVRLYLMALEEAGRSLSHLSVSLAAIRKAHELAGQIVPRSERLSTLLRALRRTLGPKAEPARAISVEELRAMLAAVAQVHAAPETPPAQRLRCARDRALLLVLYLAGLRRSELCALLVADARRSGEGYVLRIRSSKMDPEGKGADVGLPLLEAADVCPVRALDAWLLVRDELGRAPDGPLFPSLQDGRPGRTWRPLDGRDVARTVKRWALAAGLDPRWYRPHGMRAGVATETSRRGASIKELQAHLRHADLESTLRYVRHGEALARTNPARVIR